MNLLLYLFPTCFYWNLQVDGAIRLDTNMERFPLRILYVIYNRG